jgi:hypothetical protein
MLPDSRRGVNPSQGGANRAAPKIAPLPRRNEARHAKEATKTLTRAQVSKVEHSTTIGDTFATQWVATADFLAEPYRGSDAYITKNGLMQAMVTTFDGGALKMKK